MLNILNFGLKCFNNTFKLMTYILNYLTKKIESSIHLFLTILTTILSNNVPLKATKITKKQLKSVFLP